MRPEIPSVPAYALLDTGSTACSVSIDLAEALGHKIDRDDADEIETAGEPVQGWRHTFKIEVFYMEARGPDSALVDETRVIIHLPWVTVDVLDSNIPALLGVRGFLENYTLIANFHECIFSLKDARPTRGICGI
jgi:hypothetical protein